MVVAGEGRRARRDQQRRAREHERERGVGAGLGHGDADCRSGEGGGSVAGMASAELGVTASVPMAQTSAMRRWLSMRTSRSAPLQRG